MRFGYIEQNNLETYEKLSRILYKAPTVFEKKIRQFSLIVIVLRLQTLGLLNSGAY